jgi:hypothetical protein
MRPDHFGLLVAFVGANAAAASMDPPSLPDVLTPTHSNELAATRRENEVALASPQSMPNKEAARPQRQERDAPEADAERAMERMRSSQRRHQQEIAEMQRTHTAQASAKDLAHQHELSRMQGDFEEQISELATVERRAHEHQLLAVRISHGKAMQDLQQQLDFRTGELETLRRTCTCSGASVAVTQPDQLLLQHSDNSEGSGRTAAASGRDAKSSHDTAALATHQASSPAVSFAWKLGSPVVGSLVETPEVRPLALQARRKLLREDTAQRFCSSAEMRTVLDVTTRESREDAVKTLLTTNTPCGLCILQRSKIPLPDILLALQGCMHQEENWCDASTGLSRIESLIPLASVHDRISIVRMVEAVEAGVCITSSP